jgi:hypothetical protein
MLRNGNNVSIYIWYEMAMVRNGYGTKMIFTMVRNGRYEMVMVRNDCNSYYTEMIEMAISFLLCDGFTSNLKLYILESI